MTRVLVVLVLGGLQERGISPREEDGAQVSAVRSTDMHDFERKSLRSTDGFGQ